MSIIAVCAESRCKKKGSCRNSCLFQIKWEQSRTYSSKEGQKDESGSAAGKGLGRARRNAEFLRIKSAELAQRDSRPIAELKEPVGGM